MKKIVIVDPIFRASRLIYSHMVAQEAQEEKMQIHIITRTNASTEQYQELFRDIDHTLHEVVDVPLDFWWGVISDEGIHAIAEQLLALDNTFKFDLLYFAGGHEIFPKIVDQLILERYTVLRDKSIVMVDYEADFLLPIQHKINWKNPRQFLQQKSTLKKIFAGKKQKYNKFFQLFPHTSIGILDERIANVKTNRHFFYLPDPSPDVKWSKIPAASYHEPIKVMIVGLQTNRKGFDEIIKLLNQYETHLLSISLHFVGRLSDDTEQFRSQLTNSSIVKWDEGYFSEEDIRNYYYQCDYILMPYSTSFHGSSGVMAYAAAFGKPMITTSHGCIGYRNKKYKMGFTYTYGKIAQLYKILNHLPCNQSKIYQNMQNACKLFSNEHTVSRHKEIIFKKLKGLDQIMEPCL